MNKREKAKLVRMIKRDLEAKRDRILARNRKNAAKMNNRNREYWKQRGRNPALLSGNPKLTPDQVRQIRRLHAQRLLKAQNEFMALHGRLAANETELRKSFGYWEWIIQLSANLPVSWSAVRHVIDMGTWRNV